ncbi:MAG: cysteine--tRNA ligase [Alphaproteobacteria bacterium]|nr:cysteine--tRNA ligase [Alphaproteobacteria bacterium]
MSNIRLSNSLTRQVEAFAPYDPKHIKLYVCGPTVYARPHIGNARSVVVYDVLYRLLKHEFPNVTYVRNITDVDDKINAAAVERGITIQALTQEITSQFHEDMAALGCLRPSMEPKATEHIAQMITMIESLIAKGHAYVAEGHVLFAVQTNPNYGCLSRRSVDDMVAGARVEVAPYKKYAGDFVLWKPASEKDDPSSKFESPWGIGRPGWHIECSAMSHTHLGADFDIHGGGADLMFPHHENEIAQSTCAHPESHFAKYWVHNGFLTVEGEKMSKSLGNFITVHDLLQKGVKGEVIRFALMLTRYNEPLDWSEKLLGDAQKVMDRLYRQDAPAGGKADDEVLEALRDNLNTPKALARLQTLTGSTLKATANMLGLLQMDAQAWFQGEGEDTLWIEVQIEARNAAKKARDFATSDAIREMLKAKGIVLEDSATGTTWRRA